MSKYNIEVYEKWITEKRKKLNDFEIKFAFSKEQLDDVIEYFEGTDNMLRVFYNGYIRKSKFEDWHKLVEELNENFLEKYKDNDEAIKGAYWYELCNYEALYNTQLLYDLSGCFGVDEDYFDKDCRYREVYNYYMQTVEA